MRRFFGLVLAFAWGCKTPIPDNVTVTSTRTVEAPPMPGLRLPASPRPLRYRAVIELGESLSGEIEIDLLLDKPTTFLWLNGTELQIRSATISQAGKQAAVRVVKGDEDLIGFAFESALPAGEARLAVSYSGRITDEDDLGVFRDRVAGDRYVFTQFENHEARKAMPCFDEPMFKVPWTLSLIIDEGDVAAANTPLIKTTALPHGKKRLDFAQTMPLPSYLVAFVVGPFDVVDLGTAGSRNTPLRIFVPRGEADGTRFVQESFPQIFRLAEEYFGTPYPYEKLDYVAIPRTVSYGAMENAALITAGRSYMLARDEEQTTQFERRAGLIIAHEIAHQWFGNLVTLTWWDDIWLNEAFSSWMEGILMERWRPEWTWSARTMSDVSYAMQLDSLISARRIRQPILSKDDIQNAFDDITYDKGRGVMWMFEAWLGAKELQRAIPVYLQRFAHQSATSADFLSVLSEVTGRDVAPAFLSFLDQPGVPVVQIELICSERTKPLVQLTQARHLPIGSPGAGDQLWKIPIALRFEGGRATALLTEQRLEVPLEGACPKWIIGNEGGRGYYHVALDRTQLATLVALGPKVLSLEERLAVIRDAGAMIASGKLRVEDVLRHVPAWLRDPSLHVQQAAAELVAGLNELLIPTDVRPAFARWLRNTFGARGKSLGIRPKTGDPLEARLLRPVVIALLANRGEDAALIAEAKQLSDRWLADPSALEQEMIGPLVRIAARYGDRKFFDRVRAVLKTESDPRRRDHLIDALASFRDPALVKESLSMFVDGSIDPREGIALLEERDLEAQEAEWAFVKDNFDLLVDKLPGETKAALPRYGTRFCDPAHRDDVAEFFAARIGNLVGGPRNLDSVLEEITLCSALRQAQEQSFRDFLRH